MHKFDERETLANVRTYLNKEVDDDWVFVSDEGQTLSHDCEPNIKLQEFVTIQDGKSTLKIEPKKSTRKTDWEEKIKRNKEMFGEFTMGKKDSIIFDNFEK